MYFLNENETVDLFKYMVVAQPGLYSLFQKNYCDNKFGGENGVNTANQQGADVSSDKLPRFVKRFTSWFQKKQTQTKKSSVAAGIGSLLGMAPGVQTNEQMVEVFDVEIKSNLRLSIVDPATGEDILFTENHIEDVKRRILALDTLSSGIDVAELSRGGDSAATATAGKGEN
jgi:hypothetical protein